MRCSAHAALLESGSGGGDFIHVAGEVRAIGAWAVPYIERRRLKPVRLANGDLVDIAPDSEVHHLPGCSMHQNGATTMLYPPSVIVNGDTGELVMDDFRNSGDWIVALACCRQTIALDLGGPCRQIAFLFGGGVVPHDSTDTTAPEQIPFKRKATPSETTK
jgi:hypothetical protein